jgi:hypothetical protein
MTVRSTEQLNQALSDDLIWRKKELTALKFLIESTASHPDRRTALLRGGIAMLYAHWEGFVKAAARFYIEFLHFQRLRYEQLAPNFLALSIRGKLHSAGASNKVHAHIELIEFFLGHLGEQSFFPYREGLSTRSNLSSSVLREITETLGLDFNGFATKAILIDERLVDARNTIAHGEYLRVDLADFEELHSEVLVMLELFRNEIDNAVAMGAFRAA